MERKIKLFIKSRFFKFIGMPILLIILWAILTLQYIVSFDSSLLILPYNHPITDFNNLTFNPLMKEYRISGKFVAPENNLGIIQLRFNYHKRIAYKDEDNLLFRIKEKGAKNWYYQSIYKSGLISDVPFLPFGFPQIADSKGKTYDFELISENGNSLNAVSLKNRYPVLISKYKVIKTELFQNKASLVKFIAKKYIRGLENIDIFFSSVAYALPLFFYLLLISPLGPYIMKPMKLAGVKILNFLDEIEIFGIKLLLVTRIRKAIVSYFDIMLLLFVLIDIFIMQVPNDAMYIVILVLWWYFTRVQKRDTNRTFAVGLSFIILSPFLLALNLYPTAEKSTIWGYIFLLSWFLGILINSRNLSSKI